MKKAKITVEITKEMPLGNNTIEELIQSYHSSPYTFLNEGEVYLDVYGEVSEV